MNGWSRSELVTDWGKLVYRTLLQAIIWHRLVTIEITDISLILNVMYYCS